MLLQVLHILYLLKDVGITELTELVVVWGQIFLKNSFQATKVKPFCAMLHMRNRYQMSTFVGQGETYGQEKRLAYGTRGANITNFNRHNSTGIPSHGGVRRLARVTV